MAFGYPTVWLDYLHHGFRPSLRRARKCLDCPWFSRMTCVELITQFPQIGQVQKTPESTTSATLKEIHCPYLSQQVERKLPPIYKIREKQAANKSFPFSVHDNRYSFENSGYYFDYGLGRKKTSPERRQHISRNFNLWACDFIPSHLDGLSNNRTSYVHKEAMVISTFRRFPRCYDEKWSAFKFVPRKAYTEFLENEPNEEFSVDTEAVSPQEPD